MHNFASKPPTNYDILSTSSTSTVATAPGAGMHGNRDGPHRERLLCLSVVALAIVIHVDGCQSGWAAASSPPLSVLSDRHARLAWPTVREGVHAFALSTFGASFDAAVGRSPMGRWVLLDCV